MNKINRFIYWTPRLLSIVFVLFISFFALDVFSQYSGTAVLLPLFIHTLPAIMLFLFIVAAWKYELLGAVAFCGFAVWYVWSMGLNKPISWYLCIALPSYIVGLLYILSWIQQKPKKKH